MHHTIEEYNKNNPNQEPVKIGIGINTGLLMLGTIGEEDRMNATVISNAVNITSSVLKIMIVALEHRVLAFQSSIFQIV
jgi:adenylate cyclase